MVSPSIASVRTPSCSMCLFRDRPLPSNAVEVSSVPALQSYNRLKSLSSQSLSLGTYSPRSRSTPLGPIPESTSDPRSDQCGRVECLYRRKIDVLLAHISLRRSAPRTTDQRSLVNGMVIQSLVQFLNAAALTVFRLKDGFVVFIRSGLKNRKSLRITVRISPSEAVNPQEHRDLAKHFLANTLTLQQ